MLRKRKLLVTGSCGFIFSNFVRLVHKDNLPYEIVSIDKVTRQEGINAIYQNLSHKFYLGDIADSHFVNRVFEIERPDLIVHGAAASHVDDSIAAAQEFITSNVLGTQILLDSAIKHNVERFIYISTDEVYGQLLNDSEDSWDESACLAPRNPYAASKASGELLVQAAAQTHGLKYNITRSCNNFGPRQSLRNFIPKIIGCILKKQPIPVYDQGLQIREWIHVVDNCYAICKIIEEAPPNEVYNISTGYEITNLELVNAICNIMEDGHDLISFIPDARPGHDFRYSINSSKLRQLGWNNIFKFRDGLKHTVKWYTKNQWWFR